MAHWMQHLDIIFIMFLILVLSDYNATKYIYSNAVLVGVWLHFRGPRLHCSLDYICLTALAIYTSYLSKESFSYTSCPVKTMNPNLVMLNFPDELKNDVFLHWLRKFSYVSRGGYIIAHFEGRGSAAK